MPKAKRVYDLVSLGEPLLRLSPPRTVQLRRASSFDAHVAGAQWNLAANLARLGKKTTFLTKLPDNPLGHLVLDSCQAHGVDVAHIQFVAGAKLGVTYVEFSVSPRAPLAVYDRAGSAASTIGPGDFAWDRILRQSHFAYTDGIFPGLGANCRRAAIAFLQAAKSCGCTTCFDMNYREHMWTPQTARKAWSQLLPFVDILVTNRDVSKLVFGYAGTDDALLQCYARDFRCRVVCLTSRTMYGLQHGAWNSRALADRTFVEGKLYEFDVVDRYGTGDAWFAGFLYGYMEKGIAYGLHFGNALCALAHTVEGDTAHFTPLDVKNIMGGTVDLRVRR